MRHLLSSFLTFTFLFGGALLATPVTTFQLPGGSMDAAGERVSASAAFSFDAFGNLTITLTNLTTNEVSDGQAVTGLKFSVSNMGGAVSLISQKGHEININSGNVTDLGVVSLTHWTASTVLPRVTLTTIGAGAPINSILGPVSADGKYDSGNGSLGSVKNPWVENSATFLLGVPGCDPSTLAVSNVSIGFGTAGTNYLNAVAVTSATPEPGSLWLLAAGGAIFAGIRRARTAVQAG